MKIDMHKAIRGQSEHKEKIAIEKRLAIALKSGDMKTVKKLHNKIKMMEQ